MSLGCKRNAGETWRDCAIRYAARYGLQDEVVGIFDFSVISGAPEDQACWDALCEWDLLDFREDSP